MKQWSFFDSLGRFSARTYTGNEDHLTINTPAGYTAIEGVYDYLAQKVDTATGTVVDYVPPTPPADEMQTWGWDASTKRWLAMPTLVAHKAAKWEQIKQWREVAFDVPLVTPYGTFDSDSDSRRRIAEAVLLTNNVMTLGMPSDIKFTKADNTRATLTGPQMITVGLMLGAKVQAAYDRADALRTVIEAATTIEAVEAATWTA